MGLTKPIHEIVREYVVETHGRMPKSDVEIDYYLDLISHAKEYSEAFEMEQLIDKRLMEKLGFKTTNQIAKKGNDIISP